MPSCVGACFTPAQPVVLASMEVRGAPEAPPALGVPGAAGAADDEPPAPPSATRSASALASTADFSRRSMNGLQSFLSSSDARAPADRWRSVASLLCPAAMRLAYSRLNSCASPSRPGQHRSYSAQSSFRSFWMGVPVITSRCDEGSVRIFIGNCAAGFLSLCPSSHTIQSHSRPPRARAGMSCPLTAAPRPLAAATRSASSSDSGAPSATSLCVTMPYVLRSTPPRSVTARSALSRSDLEPPPAYLNRFTPSTRPATTNSLPQCGSSVVGARHSTRFAARLRSRPAANAATCRVFPKPMSSARIPPRPCSCRFHIQRTPSRWWSYRRDASAPASSKRGPPSRPFRRIGRGPPDGSSGFRGDTWEGALPRSEAKGAPLGDALEARGFDRVVAGVAGVAARRGSGGPGAGTDGARACGGLVAGATGAKGAGRGAKGAGGA